MIAVIASGFDAGAAVFVRSLGGNATLLLPEDLSKRGWRFHPGDASRPTAVPSGGGGPRPRNTGALTLLACQDERDLLHLVAEGRPYVAAEMTPFLPAWLSMLPPSVRVITRPQPGCLTGPPWSPLRWKQEAARAGFLISTAGPPRSPLTVAADQSIGSADAAARSAAHKLASAAGMEVLSLHLDARSAFVAASHRPSLDQPGVAAALQGIFYEGTR